MWLGTSSGGELARKVGVVTVWALAVPRLVQSASQWSAQGDPRPIVPSCTAPQMGRTRITPSALSGERFLLAALSAATVVLTLTGWVGPFSLTPSQTKPAD